MDLDVCQICLSLSFSVSMYLNVCSIRSDVGQCVQVTEPYRALSTVSSSPQCH